MDRPDADSMSIRASSDEAMRSTVRSPETSRCRANASRRRRQNAWRALFYGPSWAVQSGVGQIATDIPTICSSVVRLLPLRTAIVTLTACFNRLFRKL